MLRKLVVDRVQVGVQSRRRASFARGAASGSSSHLNERMKRCGGGRKRLQQFHLVALLLRFGRRHLLPNNLRRVIIVIVANAAGLPLHLFKFRGRRLQTAKLAARLPIEEGERWMFRAPSQPTNWLLKRAALSLSSGDGANLSLADNVVRRCATQEALCCRALLLAVAGATVMILAGELSSATMISMPSSSWQTNSSDAAAAASPTRSTTISWTTRKGLSLSLAMSATTSER